MKEEVKRMPLQKYNPETKKVHAQMIWNWDDENKELKVFLKFCLPGEDPCIVDSLLLTVNLKKVEMCDKKNKPHFHLEVDVKTTIEIIELNEYYNDYWIHGNFQLFDSVHRIARERAKRRIISEYHKDEIEVARDNIEFHYVNYYSEKEETIPQAVWYFTYGPDMDEELLKGKVGPYLVKIPAVLRDKRLIFSIADENYSDIGLVNFEKRKNNIIWGVAYLISSEQLKMLKILQFTSLVYENYAYTIYVNNLLTLNATAFYCLRKSEFLGKSLLPTREYLSHMIKGAEGFLPEYYVRKLKAIKTFEDSLKDDEKS
jgi:hypothetical protein